MLFAGSVGVGTFRAEELYSCSFQELVDWKCLLLGRNTEESVFQEKVLQGQSERVWMFGVEGTYSFPELLLLMMRFPFRLNKEKKESFVRRPSILLRISKVSRNSRARLTA